MSHRLLRVRDGFVVLGILALCIPASESRAEPGPNTGSEQVFVDWVRDHALPLNTLDWREIDLSDLSFLDKALEGKRIVYLGESDHYIHEKYDFRLILIRYLFEKGWRHIGMEMGISDGKRIDRYLETGDTAHLDRVALLGYRGDLRSDRDDIPVVFQALNNDEFKKAWRHEESTFFHRLRSLNESLEPGKPRLSWFGFDIDVLSGGGYVDARDLLGPYESQPLAREILGRLERVPGESMAEERARLVDALAFLDSENAKMERMLGVTKAADLKRTLRCMADGFLFLDTASDMRRWVEALATREQTMYRQMDETLEALPHDEKIILLGHALHLSKDSDTILLNSPSGQPFPMWLSIGTYLARKQPGQVYSVWMQYDHGRHGNMVLESGFNDVPSQPERIEYLLAKAGPAFVLPLHTGDEGESYLKQMRTFVQNGSVANGVLVNQADAIFFVEEVTAIQGP